MTLNYKELSEKYDSVSTAMAERARIMAEKTVPPNKRRQQANTIARLILKSAEAKDKAEKYRNKKDAISSSSPEYEKLLIEKLSELREVRDVFKAQGNPYRQLTKQISQVKSKLNVYWIKKQYPVSWTTNGTLIEIVEGNLKVHYPLTKDRMRFEEKSFKYSFPLKCYVRKLSQQAITTANELCTTLPVNAN